MAVANGLNPTFDGLQLKSVTLTPTAAQGGVNSIPAGAQSVRLGANVNGVTDFVVLPSLADVQDGHCVTIIAGSANCEVRTPSASAEEINSEDCDSRNPPFH